MIKDMKKGIEAKVKQHAQAHGIKLKSWHSYVFQYQGQNINDNKYIFINALCDKGSIKRDLSNKIIHYFDGGSCYFNLKYDPVRKDYFDIVINGVA